MEQLGATREDPEVLDSHVHVWAIARRPQPWIDPVSMALLNRDWLVPDLEREMARAGVVGALLVQVLNDATETDDYVELAAVEPFRGVVPWVDLLDARAGSRLDELAARPGGQRIVGVRHQALAETDPAGWLRHAAAAGGLAELGRRGLACDLMVASQHLPTVYEIGAAHPGTTFVLDHAGKAPVLSGWRSSQSQIWANGIRALGGLPNMCSKLSGMSTMADLERWTVADLVPYVDHLLEVFGPDRLMFGSDWPVSLRAGDYLRTVDTARELVAPLTRAEQSDVLSGTASRVYGLS